MTPLYLHNAAATTLVDVPLITWAVSEAYLRRRNRAATTKLEWSFFVVVGTIAAGFLVGFRAQLVAATVIGGWAPVIAGTAILIAGLGLRLWSMLVLGRFFTVTVTIQDDHHVVESGPYRVLRHPSYTGLLVLLAGFGLGLGNWLSLLALVALPLAGILLRIRAEEAALSHALGASYANYAAHTDRLIPGVW